MSQLPRSNNFHHILLMIGLAGCVFLAYSSSLSAGFIWDDKALILNDKSTHSLKNITSALTRDFFSQEDQLYKYGYYRPLVTISYMIDFAIAGPKAWFFHFANILWHLGVTLLLYMMIFSLSQGNKLASFIGALLFGLHPVHTESVTWIAGRTDLICAFFGMLSLLAANKYFRDSFQKQPSIKWLTLASLLYGGSLLSKEMAVVFMAAALLISQMQKEKIFRKNVFLLMASYGLISGLYLVMRVFVAGVKSHALIPQQHSLLSALFTFPSAFLLYLSKLFFPIHQSAYIQTPYQQSPFSISGIVGIIFLVSLIFFAIKLRKSKPFLSLFIAMFIFSFIPLMNLWRISAPGDMGFPVAERFLYIPSIWLVGLMGIALSQTKNQIRLIVSIALCFIVIAFGYQTFKRGADYKSDLVFFEKAYRDAPESPLLGVTYGNALRNSGQSSRAILVLEKARDINEKQNLIEPTSLYNSLGVAYGAAGRLEDAIRALHLAAATNRNQATVSLNLSQVFQLKGDYLKCVEFTTRSLQAGHEKYKPLSLRAQCNYRLKNMQDALKDLNTLGALYPQDAEVFMNLGLVYKATGKIDDAIKMFENAKKRNDNDVRSLMHLGTLYIYKNQLQKALPLLKRAYELDPNAVATAGAFGAVLYKTGDTVQAKILFDRTLKLHPNSPEAHLNLIDYFFESGNLTQAQIRLQKAAALFPNHPKIIKYQQMPATKNEP